MSSAPDFDALDAITRSSYRTFGDLPGGALLDDGAVFAVRNTIPLTFFNGIATTRLRDGSQIDGAWDFYRQTNCPFRWWVSPASTPAGLDQLLLSRGFNHTYDSLGMTADLAQLQGAKPTEMRIRRIRDDEEMALWAAIITTVFHRPVIDRKAWVDAFRHLGFGGDSKWAHFIGYLGDEPVATTALMTDGDVAGVYHVATMPAARGRGFGAALTLHAMRHARDLGARTAALQSSEMGEGVYRSVGFVPGPTLRLYDWRPQ